MGTCMRNNRGEKIIMRNNRGHEPLFKEVESVEQTDGCLWLLFKFCMFLFILAYIWFVLDTTGLLWVIRDSLTGTLFSFLTYYSFM